MANDSTALIAHLMRRAGFGSPQHELETQAVKGYAATIEELLTPEDQPAVDNLELLRYHPWAWKPGTMSNPGSASWMYHMVTTQRPLQEKVALFWHQVFATGNSKVDHWDEIADMIDMFREKGMGKFRDILLELAKNPAMIFWLDNNENHGESLNENWGRELLELFSLGVGNYTETDVKEASRAFTGWTFEHKLPRFPYGRFDWNFLYRWNDHDTNKKEFLGHDGMFNGEDIIDIIVEQTATAKFICRHLYNFFVADEPPVPTWPYTAPRDPEAISTLTNTFVRSDGSINDVLRTLFNSSFFKNAMFARVKSPTEVVVGTMRLVGGAEFPVLGYGEISRQPGYMGQEPLNPPTVEGWHTGNEWVNSASLMSRINFVADMLGDTNRPGVQTIITAIKGMGDLSPCAFVDAVLEQMGSIQISQSSRVELIEHAKHEGRLIPDSAGKSDHRISEMLQLVAAVRDYQFG